MIKLNCTIFLFVLLIASHVNAEVPTWYDAKKVMKSCYGGLDITIKLSAGVKGEIAKSSVVGGGNSEKNEDSFYKNGSFSIIDGTRISEEGIEINENTSLSSSEIAYDLYENASSTSSISDKDSYGTSAFVGLNLVVPLYDRETRISRREKTNSQIGNLADLYAKMEGHQATVIALKMEQKVLKRVMLDGGQSAISGYFNLITELEKSKALARSSERQIIVILESCGMGD